jgi:hypothetical protein
MKKLYVSFFFLMLFGALHVPLSRGLPVEDLKLVTDGDYFQTAMKMIQEAKSSIHIIMFEMGYYDNRTSTPSNLLIKELIAARKRGVSGGHPGCSRKRGSHHQTQPPYRQDVV